MPKPAVTKPFQGLPPARSLRESVELAMKQCCKPKTHERTYPPTQLDVEEYTKRTNAARD